MMLISMTAALMAVFISESNVALLILVASALLIGCSIIFTKWRYREIDRLSRYLRQISNGDYSLDVRDHYEGELSILKSEIYKVTVMLSEQSIHLKKDKVKLTDAISDISHQLKTPLTSMMMMADLLNDDNLPAEKGKEFTRKIRIQLERMEWLVSSLLKLSKIDAGTAQFQKEIVPVKELIHKALEPVLIPIDIKELTVTIKGEETVSFIGDLNWTVEAVINILKNCVDHSPIGGEMNILFSENPLFTEIIISDTGKGIDKEDLPYIFKRFYKGKNASEDSVGIGLAMAHSIVTSQNGDIQVKSKPKEGTQFHLKFFKQII